MINELLEKKFVGEKPMTGTPTTAAAAAVLTMSTAGLVEVPPEIKKEVSFVSLPVPPLRPSPPPSPPPTPTTLPAPSPPFPPPHHAATKVYILLINIKL